jgi:hypothetical protein
MIRFNSDSNYFEGYNGSYWIRLGGVFDTDNNTYILAESSPGANENTLYFYTGGSLSATLDSNRFSANKLEIDDIEIDGNVIRTITTNSDLELIPNGTGGVKFDGFRFTTNTITNLNLNGVTEFRSTGTGYYYISGTNAVVLPGGTDFQRPGTPVAGMVRYNSTGEALELYNGVTWGSVSGVAAGITTAEATDIAISSALIFG